LGKYIYSYERDFENFLANISRIKIDLEEESEDEISLALNLAQYLVYLNNIYRFLEVDFGDLLKVLEEAFGFAERYLDRVMKADILIKVKHKILDTLNDHYYIFSKTELRDKFKKLFDKVFDYSKRFFVEVINLPTTKRVEKFNFYTYFLDTALSIVYNLWINGKCTYDILLVMENFLSKEVEKMYGFATYQYMHYFIKALILLEHYVGFLDIEAVKKTLFRKIAGLIEELVSEIPATFTKKFMGLIYAYNAYMMTCEPDLQIVAEKFKKRVEEGFPSHLVDIIEEHKKFYEKFCGG